MHMNEPDTTDDQKVDKEREDEEEYGQEEQKSHKYKEIVGFPTKQTK